MLSSSLFTRLNLQKRFHNQFLNSIDFPYSKHRFDPKKHFTQTPKNLLIPFQHRNIPHKFPFTFSKSVAPAPYQNLLALHNTQSVNGYEDTIKFITVKTGIVFHRNCFSQEYP